MKKHYLSVILLSALSLPALRAQVVLSDNRKCDIGTAALLDDYRHARATRGTAVPDTVVTSFIITATNPHVVADSIRLLGGEATVINEEVLTARLTSGTIDRVAALSGVNRINRSRTYRPLLSTARNLTGADRVQAGTGLETPYTGKGVVIGVIDQSFQFNHVAFQNSDGSSRVVALWNRMVDKSQPTTTIPTTGSDGNRSADGHATHVTGIAAGSRIAGNDYSGMAPEADIIMVPSTFDGGEIVEDAAWIKQTAEAMGRPWVINMSFGSQIGPHDGTTTDDVSMGKLCGPGGIMVAAMGNEGDVKMHAGYTFSKAGDECVLLVVNDEGGNDMAIDFWSNLADSVQHFEVTPVAYNPTTRQLRELTMAELRRVGDGGGELAPENKKEHYQFYASMATLVNFLRVNTASAKDVRFGMKVKALTDGASFHAWTSTGYGTFSPVAGYGLTGDSNYLVGEGAASVPGAIAVASYNGAKEWVAATNGGTYSFVGSTPTGAMSGFSSPGPWLGPESKPTVAAPGATIASALNRDCVVKTDVSIVGAVNNKGQSQPYALANTLRSDFYGVKSGTSMASPAVAGIVALWLQANPTLTPAAVTDIIRSTSTRDIYTGGFNREWTAKAGYGKINAYEGLKMALQMGDLTGIGQTMDNTQPVTLSPGAGEWRILFNTAEPRAQVSLVGLDGRTVASHSLTHINQGDDFALPTVGYTPGVYVLRIVTAHATVARKVVVKP